MATASEFIAQEADGTPLAGGTVEVYVGGTSTQKTTYSDPALTVPNTWPVVLDASGRASIWISGSYKIVVKDSNGVLKETRDNMWGVGAVTQNYVDGEVGIAKTVANTYQIVNGDDLVAGHADPFTMTLPLAPLAGHRCYIHNYGVATITLARNGEAINGNAADLSILAGEFYMMKFVDPAIDPTTGWDAKLFA